MALQLTREVERRIEEQLAAGHYSSVDELLVEALDLLETHRRNVREELHRRHDQVKSGKVPAMKPDEARSRLREHHESFQRQG